MRSYEAEYVNGLWHWDCHHGSKKVLTPRGELVTPILFGVLDDRSRLACHLQWYLHENAENIAHGLSQAIQKRGLPRSAMSDNGTADDSGRDRRGPGAARRRSRDHPAAQPVPERQARELLGPGRRAAPRDARGRPGPHPRRAQRGDPGVGGARVQPQGPLRDRRRPRSPASSRARTSPGRARTARRCGSPSRRPSTAASGAATAPSSIEGRRFEIPGRYRHLEPRRRSATRAGTSRQVHLVDERHGERCSAGSTRRTRSGTRAACAARSSRPPRRPARGRRPGAAAAPRQAPRQQAATGLPPAYLPKDEGDEP